MSSDNLCIPMHIPTSLLTKIYLDEYSKYINIEVKIMKYMFFASVLILLTLNSYAYDKTKYAICYGEMTAAHKARGFHQSDRARSIKVKETVCMAYAKGEINSYEGKR